MKKRILRFLKKEIAKIEMDERYHYPPAPVQVNAPLALIQVEMKARAQAYRRAIEIVKKDGLE